MKLSRFIIENLEQIIGEWEAFARTLQPAASGISPAELRDHAKSILKAIALDIETTESARQKMAKSVGMAPTVSGPESAASAHGLLRQVAGFSMPQLTAEYRAMRASVLRLWLPQLTKVTNISSADMLRFNEAIDQALQESAIAFAAQTERTRDIFLAMLGHDLRSPLATISMAGVFLTSPNEGTERTQQIGARVKRSAVTMTTMVNDLLEYARTQLGGKMPIVVSFNDVGAICQAALDDASSAHPECAFELKSSGNLLGDFDSPRLQQVFSNLLNNAAQYKGKKYPVTITARGEASMIVVEVRNYGPVIPENLLSTIFDPMVQLSVSTQQKGPGSTSLGLGLFIAREITSAHGGAISVESSEDFGTLFTVCVPRTPNGKNTPPAIF
jgi:signal transduction histidine kinase